MGALFRAMLASVGVLPPPTGKLFWRFNITASRTQDVYPTTVLEAEMRSVIGGADLCVGGTASASSQEGTYPASKAFDGLVGSEDVWVPLPGALPQWLRYNLPSAAEIVEVMLQAATTTTRAARAPQSFDVQWSTDGVVWTTAFTVIGTPAWGTSESRTFTAQGDPYFDQVVSLLHFDGPNNSTVFHDVKGKTWTATGNAQLSSSLPIRGPTSLLLDGTGDWVTCASNDDLGFGTGDFTIECFANSPGTGTQYVFSFGPNWIVYYAGNTLYFNINGVNHILASILTRGTNNHIALTRSAGVVRLFCDGQLLGSGVFATDIAAAAFNLGRYPSDAGNHFSGRIDELRITRGVARYTANFTPPTEPFPNYRDVTVDPFSANVVSLLHFDGTDESTTFADAAGKVWSAVGNAKIDSAQSRFGGTSGNFDGAGDNINSSSHEDFGFGAGDFTVEGWAYQAGASGAFCLFDNRSAANQGFGLYAGGGTGIGAGKLTYFDNSAAIAIYASTAMPVNSMFHWAVTRNGSTVRLFQNGTLVGSGTDSRTFASSAAPFIGASYVNSQNFAGWVDEVRVTKGVARYTADFTPHGPFLNPPKATDFNSYSLGVAPFNWTPRWVTTTVTYTAQEVSGRRVLRADVSSAARRIITWNRCPLTADVEILALVRAVQAPAGGQIGPRIVVRGKNTALGNEHGYALQLRDGPNQLEVSRFNDAGTATEASTPYTWSVGQWHWMRLRVVGTSIKAKAWPELSPEPAAWMLDYTSSTVTEAGYVGFGAQSVDIDCDFFSFDDTGGTAPGP